MRIIKKQFISIIDMCTLLHALELEEYLKDFEMYACDDLTDYMIYLMAMQIIVCRNDIELTDSNIVSVINTILECVTIEYILS